MRKTYLPALAFLLVTLISLSFSSIAFLASLSLTKIGALNTNGSVYSEWWYTKENPTLSGTAETGASVAITIDDASSSVTADSSGVWSFSSTTLLNGDHTVKISSSGNEYSFTLHVGSTVPADVGSSSSGSSSTNGSDTTPQTTSAVPETGFDQLFPMLISAGLIGFGVYFYKSQNAKGVFEREITQD